MKNSKSSDWGENLHNLAESTYRQRHTHQDVPRTKEEMQVLVHELQVHQIELEMQNDELHRTRENLEAAQARYFDLYNQAPVGYLTINEKGIIEESNAAAGALFGTTPASLLMKEFTLFILPEDQDIYYLYQKQVFETEKAHGCDLRFRNEDGTIFWAHLVSNVARGEGAVLLHRTTLIDITRSKRAEEALRKSKNQYNHLVAKIPIGVYLLHSNPPGTLAFNYVSPRAADLLDLTIEQFLVDPKIALKLVHPEDLDSFLEIMQGRIQQKAPFDWVGRVIVSGQLKWLHTQASPEEIENGDVLWQGIVEDITDRKLAEMALQQSEARFHNLVEAAPVAIYMYRAEKPIYGNALFMNMMGLRDAGELQKRPVIENIAPQARAEIIERTRRRSLGLPLPNEYDTILQRVDGSQFSAHVYVNQVTLADGPVILTFVADISEQKQAEAAQQESEEKYRVIFNNEVYAISIFDLDNYRFLDVNDAYVRLYGYSREELLDGMTVKDISAEPANSIGSIQQKSNQGTSLVPLRYTRRKDGVVIPVEIVSGPYTWKGRRVMFALVHDISSRKNAEEKILFQAHLLENAGEAVIATDPNDKIIYWNKSAEDMLGWRAEEVLGKVSRSMMRNDLNIKKAAEIKEQMLSGNRWSGDIQEQCKDGSVVELLGTLTRVCDSQGKLTSTIGVLHDVSERKRIENELRLSEQKFSAAFHSNTALMALTDADGAYTEVNDTFLNTFGYTRDEVIGRTSLQLKLFVDPDVHAKGLQLLRESGHLSNMEIRLYTKSGSIRYVLLSTSILMVDGKPHKLNVMVDVTETRELASKLVAAEKMAGIGTLAAGMAHELNTPLQVITGYSETAAQRIRQGNVDPDRLLRNLENIHENGLRCASIVHSLLTYARPGSEEMQFEDLNQVVRDTLILIEHQLRTWDSIRVVCTLAEGLPQFPCNRNQVSQGLVNLLTNARNVLKKGGSITIATGVDLPGQRIWLQVADSGPGIPPELRVRIFEPFYTTNPVGEGTGLGLSILSTTMHQHGGEITVGDADPHGAVMTLYFPLSLAAPLPGKANDPGPLGRYETK